MPRCRRTTRTGTGRLPQQEYLEETTLTKKPKTLSAYRTALSYFTDSCHKLNLEDVDRKDLLKFCAFLRDEKG